VAPFSGHGVSAPIDNTVVCLLCNVRPMSHLQFNRATLSRNFIARQNRISDMACRATLEQSRNSFSQQSSDYSVQLCRENAVNADWSILVIRQSCSVRHAQLHTATLSCDKIASVTSVLTTR